MNCPNKCGNELQVEGEFLRCPTCGVFREDNGELRILANDASSDGKPIAAARQVDRTGDDVDTSGTVRGDDSPRGNDGHEDRSPQAGQADTQGRDRTGGRIEFKPTELDE